jgi:hypothetical protein
MDYTPYPGFATTTSWFNQYAAAIGGPQKLAIGISCMGAAAAREQQFHAACRREVAMRLAARRRCQKARRHALHLLLRHPDAAGQRHRLSQRHLDLDDQSISSGRRVCRGQETGGQARRTRQGQKICKEIRRQAGGEKVPVQTGASEKVSDKEARNEKNNSQEIHCKEVDEKDCAAPPEPALIPGKFRRNAAQSIVGEHLRVGQALANLYPDLAA